MTVNITVIFSRSYCTSQQPKPHHQSADKVGGLPRLFFRQAKLFLAQLDALHQEGHIACQCPHGLQALSILRSLARRSPMGTIPVLAGCNGHTRDGEELIELIKSCRQTATPGHHYTCPHLHGLVKAGAEEHAGQVINLQLNIPFFIYRTADKEKYWHILPKIDSAALDSLPPFRVPSPQQQTCQAHMLPSIP